MRGEAQELHIITQTPESQSLIVKTLGYYRVLDEQ